MADAAKKNSFEEAADFLLITAPAPKSNQSKIQRVSAIKTGKIKVGPKTGVEIRFYKRPEWERLKEEERNEVIELRRNNKNGGRKRKSHGGNEQAKKISALESQIEEQANIIASLRKHEGSDKKLPPNSRHPLQPPPGYTQNKGK